MVCTDTNEPIQPAGTLDGIAQCASCYLEGRADPCASWTHIREDNR